MLIPLITHLKLAELFRCSRFINTLQCTRNRGSQAHEDSHCSYNVYNCISFQPSYIFHVPFQTYQLRGLSDLDTTEIPAIARNRVRTLNKLKTRSCYSPRKSYCEVWEFSVFNCSGLAYCFKADENDEEYRKHVKRFEMLTKFWSGNLVER